jgi:hypothetical protein
VDVHVPRADVVGAIRPNLLIRYLPAEGWAPIVITQGTRRGQEATDGAIIRSVPSTSLIGAAKARSGVSLTPSEGVSSASAQGQRSRTRRVAVEIASLFPDNLAWALRASRAGIALARKHEAAVVYSSSPSPAAHLAAWIVAMRTGLPWVAELRDLWSQRPSGLTTRLRRLPDAFLESLLFRRAAALVTISDGLAEQLQARHPHMTVHAIPTGFDPELRSSSSDVALEFLLVYAGRAHAKQHPQRVLGPLRDAIRAGSVNPARTRVELYTMGSLRDADRAFIEANGLRDVVLEQPLVPRSDLLRREREAQVLLHLRWDDPSEPGFLTGKFMEYLAAGRPILSTGAFEDEVSTILQKTGAGVATTTDAETEAYLADAFRSFEATGSVPYQGDAEAVATYDARSMVASVARVLDGVASEPPKAASE